MSLISEIRQDLDASALQLITEYRDRLFAEAVRLSADVSAAEDLVSCTLVKAIRNLESHRKDESVFAWMKSIMLNLHRNDMRSPVRRGTAPVDPSVLEERSEADWTTDEEILRRSDSQALREAMGRLDPEYKKTMVLHYLSEMPVKQIAAVMNVPVGTVLWRLNIARKILARDLAEKLGKKPVAVLLAALLSVGTLFGAWVSPLGDWVAEKVFGSAPAAETVQDEEPAPDVDLPSDVEGPDDNELQDNGVEPAGEERVASTPAPQADTNVISETQKQKGEGNMNISARIKKTVAAASVAAMGLSAQGKTCTWVGMSESASLPSNWSDSALPESGDAIVLDSTSSANMKWDLKSVVPASWTQTADYAGKVTFATTYAENDFPVFKVNGNVVINGGTWTHLANPNASAKNYLLRVEATGDFTLGASAKIDVSVLGYKLGGPGDYTDSTDKYGERGASYGGIAGNNSTAQGPDSPRYKGQEACYGSIKHPLDPGSGAGGQYAKTTGGGIAFVTCGGTMTIDGEVAADGNKNSIYGGSGGSILLTAGKVVGGGYVHANALDCTHAGGGGRISIIQNGAGEAYFGEGENATGRVEAMSPQGKSGAGTVYQEIVADEGLGTLFVRMPSGVKGGKDYTDAAYTEFSTNMTGYAEDPDDWKFGKIVLGNNPRVSVCTGATLDLSETEVVGDATTPFAIRGTVLFGTDDVVLPTLCWHLRGESGTQFGDEMKSLTLPSGVTVTLDRKLSVPGDMVVESGATLTHRAGATRWLDLSVAGALTIEEGAFVTADGTGYTKDTGLDYSTAQEGKSIHGDYFKPGHASCGLNLTARGDYKSGPPINEPLPPAYGSIISPTNHGSASFEAAGGGVIRIAATGALTLGGCVMANGLDANNCAGAGGSVWLKAATMTMGQNARISADGGRMTNMGGAYSGGSGGRVSLVLTNPAADFANVAMESVSAYGCAFPDNYGFGDFINASGTVYFQTGAEESGSGTIIVAARTRYSGKVYPDTCAPRAMTPIPSTMLCDPNELKKPKLIVRTNASVGIQTNMKLGDLQVEDDQCLLDLGGHVLNIGTGYHAYKSAGIINAGDWIDDPKKPGYANIKWRTLGLMIMFY